MGYITMNFQRIMNFYLKISTTRFNLQNQPIRSPRCWIPDESSWEPPHGDTGTQWCGHCVLDGSKPKKQDGAWGGSPMDLVVFIPKSWGNLSNGHVFTIPKSGTGRISRPVFFSRNHGDIRSCVFCYCFFPMDLVVFKPLRSSRRWWLNQRFLDVFLVPSQKLGEDMIQFWQVKWEAQATTW